MMSGLRQQPASAPPIPGCCLGCGLPYGWTQVHALLYTYGDGEAVARQEHTGTRSWTIWTRDHGVVPDFPDPITAMLTANQVLVGDLIWPTEGWPLAAK